MIPTFSFFFFNDTATTEIYPLSLHDALPISNGPPFSFQSGRRVHRRIMNSPPDGLAMTERPKRPVQAYRNPGFLNSKDARELRILAEYLEPKSRFDYHKVDDTIVFMGSARL